MMKSLLVLLLMLAGVHTSAQTQPQPIKEWTLLVYLNADNSLYEDGIRNLQQMEKIGSTADMNMVVEFDPEPSGMATTRFLVTQSPTPPILQKLGETDMGDYKHFADFLTWGMQNFPARHYAVVVWNHGDGWQGVSYDDHPSTHMTIPALAQGIRLAKQNLAPTLMARGYRGGPIIDILNFDACLMSSIEVAYELKDLAGIMIGSQYNEPGPGEDYTAILTHLVQNPHLPSRDLAAAMVYEYVKQYPSNPAINYLALDMSKVDSFTALFRVVAAQHVAAPANVKAQLKRFYNGSVEGSDLIGAMTGARKFATGIPAFSQALDAMITNYGYPAERDTRVGLDNPGLLANPSLVITRYTPSVVNYRASSSSGWQKMKLVQQADGSYQASIPRSAAGQYVVQRLVSNFADNVGAQEATTTYLRMGANPIVFHSQFPQGSPVIAEAHTALTKGAMGMSIYLGMANLAKAERRADVVPQLMSEYMKLQFATVGAPDWTRWMGN